MTKKGIIVVVEGKNDYSKLKNIYPNMQIIITNGSAISDELVANLIKLKKDNEIILFLDPDGPGRIIRKHLENVLSNVSHAFLDTDKAISKNKRKVGIEHATEKDLRFALDNYYKEDKKEIYSFQDLYDFGLVGNNFASYKRAYIGKRLNIGYNNGKTFLSRVNMFSIERKLLEKCVKEFDDDDIKKNKKPLK